jgi:hypothetical protein
METFGKRMQMIQGNEDLRYRANNCEEFDNKDFDQDGDIHSGRNEAISLNSRLQHYNMLRQLIQNELLRKRDIKNGSKSK